MNFKKYFYTLEEGVLEVPDKVMKDIENYYFEMYEKYRTMGSKRVTDQTFPPKVFTLDFSGTKYDFLDTLDPKPSVKLYFSKNKSWEHAYDKKVDPKYSTNIIEKSNMGVITLDFQNFRQSIYQIKEHEMVHLIQDLIQKYKHVNRRNPVPFEQTTPGGLPSKNVMRRDIEVSGFAKNRRVKHAHRPIEYYTDLLTVIRQMQAGYLAEIRKDPNFEKLKSSESKKKEFFNKVYDAVKRGEKYFQVLKPDSTTPFLNIYTYLLVHFKAVGEKFFRKMITILYNAFVNKEPSFDLDYIEGKRTEIINSSTKKRLEKFENEQKIKQTTPEKGVKFDTRRHSGLSIEYTDAPELLGEFDEEDPVFSPIEGNSTSFTTEFLDNAGVQEKEKNGYGIYTLPTKKSAIINLFKTLKKWKDTFEGFDPQTKEDKEKISSFYDKTFETIKTKYITSLLGTSGGAVDLDTEAYLSSVIDGAYGK